ncbi:hypothetical protein V8E54_002199 [Elaphomyces granulatus]
MYDFSRYVPPVETSSSTDLLTYASSVSSPSTLPPSGRHKRSPSRSEPRKLRCRKPPGESASSKWCECPSCSRAIRRSEKRLWEDSTPPDTEMSDLEASEKEVASANRKANTSTRNNGNKGPPVDLPTAPQDPYASSTTVTVDDHHHQYRHEYHHHHHYHHHYHYYHNPNLPPFDINPPRPTNSWTTFYPVNAPFSFCSPSAPSFTGTSALPGPFIAPPSNPRIATRFHPVNNAPSFNAPPPCNHSACNLFSPENKRCHN